MVGRKVSLPGLLFKLCTPYSIFITIKQGCSLAADQVLQGQASLLVGQGQLLALNDVHEMGLQQGRTQESQEEKSTKGEVKRIVDIDQLLLVS